MSTFAVLPLGDLDDGSVELQDVYPGHKLGVRVKPDAKPALVLSAGAKQSIGEFHYRTPDNVT